MGRISNVRTVSIVFLRQIFENVKENLSLDVKELVQEAVGGPELQHCKVKVQNLSDQVSSSLKKHVYENYMQFIDTAKEISSKQSFF